jgi:WXXGXW repeat (2 copies)
MNHCKRAHAVVAFSVLVAMALPGCVVAPDQAHYAGGVVMVAPPPPRVEVIGVAPTPGYVWIGGYWNWVGGRHEWVAGHWAAGRPGRHWVAHVWVRQGDGWRMRPGHWERG